MATTKCVELPRWVRRGDPAHASTTNWGKGSVTVSFGALIGLLCLVSAAPLAAQGRRDMQVGAQVLPAGPSQAALAAALQAPATGSTPTLAEISRDFRRTEPDSAGVAIRPREVVTIAFLRN